MRVDSAAASSSQPQNLTSSSGTHRIERGDTLSELAARYGTTVQAFMKANPQIRDADLIFAGETLNIPGRSASSSGGGSASTGGAAASGAAAGAGAGAQAGSTGASNNGKFDYNSIQNVKGNPNVTPAFIAKVEAMAQRLGTKPEYLMAVMSFESGLNPKAVNGQSGATGLIQFIPSTARALGTSTEALRGMSAEQQLKYVEKYFEGFKGKLGTLEGAYTAVLSGQARPDPNSTLFSNGTLAYSQNKGLDFNRDGRITSGEATQAVASRLFGGVKAVQERLVAVGAASGNGFADGQFGPNTSDAIKKFQTSNGLAATGLLDERTGRALFGTSGGSGSTQPAGGDNGGTTANGTAWPVPGYREINRADKAGEGEGGFGTSRGGGSRSHKGLDINAPVGSKVAAFKDGTVTGVNRDPGGYGLWISVRHANGLETRYAHLNGANVKVGDTVKAGEQIGTVGRSGNTPSAGDAHLHFETRVNGTAVDPQRYLR